MKLGITDVSEAVLGFIIPTVPQLGKPEEGLGIIHLERVAGAEEVGEPQVSR